MPKIQLGKAIQVVAPITEMTIETCGVNLDTGDCNYNSGPAALPGSVHRRFKLSDKTLAAINAEVAADAANIGK